MVILGDILLSPHLRPNKICVFQVSRPYLGFCPNPKHFIVNCEQNVVVVVCSGFTSLSTIFQSYHDGVWLRQGAQCSLL